MCLLAPPYTNLVHMSFKTFPEPTAVKEFEKWLQKAFFNESVHAYGEMRTVLASRNR